MCLHSFVKTHRTVHYKRRIDVQIILQHKEILQVHWRPEIATEHWEYNDL